MCYTVITLIKAIIYILKHSFMNDLIGNISLLYILQERANLLTFQ